MSQHGTDEGSRMHQPPFGMTYPKAGLFHLTSAVGEANPKRGGSLLFHHLAIIQDNCGEKKIIQNNPKTRRSRGRENNSQEEKISAVPKHSAVVQPNQTVMIH